MTFKRIALLMVMIVLLIIFACTFLGISIYVEPFSTVAFYLLIVASFCCLGGAVLLFGFNHKKLITFIAQRKKAKLENTSFTSVNYPLTNPMEIKQLLMEHGYYEDYRFALTYKRIVHKGKVAYTEYFHETSFEEQDIFDVNKGIEFAGNEMHRHYFCVIFVQNNLEENLKNLKNYIVDIAIANVNSDKKFFFPLIISQGKLYFLKSNYISYKYTVCLNEVLRALDIENQ